MLKELGKKIKSVLGLSAAIARAEFIARNEGSYLGIFWYLLNPVLMFGLLFLIFNDRLGGSIKFYAPYLFLGVIMFNFFQNATIESVKSIIDDNRYVIKSVNFPSESLLGGIVMKNIFSHAFEILLLAVLLVVFKISLIGILFYVILLLFFSAFVFGVCLLVSSLTVYFADLDGIWNFGVRILWLATPIFYAIGGQKNLLFLNMANPMYYFITLAREVVIYHNMPAAWLLFGALAFSLIFLGVGLFVFGKLKNKLPELV
jgi:ABC-type polysaccharide/polyol phosphate export permease